jgi:hypothetical protein
MFNSLPCSSYIAAPCSTVRKSPKKFWARHLVVVVVAAAAVGLQLAYGTSLSYRQCYRELLMNS